MDDMQHLTGLRREVLQELRYAGKQLRALAEAVPAEDYGWTPAEGARSFAAVLVHVAVGNLLLLDVAGAQAPEAVDLYSGMEGPLLARQWAMARKNRDMEKAVTAKPAVVDLLTRAFAAVESCWTRATEEELWEIENFFGELETRRRLYLRMLAHSHEHMGQLIAYVRAMGYRVPWPDPLERLEEAEASLAVH